MKLKVESRLLESEEYFCIDEDGKKHLIEMRTSFVGSRTPLPDDFIGIRFECEYLYPCTEFAMSPIIISEAEDEK